MLGNDTIPTGIGTPVLVKAPLHGIVELRVDGSFVYRPDRGFTGIDSFWYLLRVNGATTNIAVVQFLVSPGPLPTPSATLNSTPAPSSSPSPTAGAAGPVVAPSPPSGLTASGPDPFTIPVLPTQGVDIQFGGADLIQGALEWLVPSIALTVPGLLIVVIVMAQALGALAWIPTVRRLLGGFGFGRRRRGLGVS